MRRNRIWIAMPAIGALALSATAATAADLGGGGPPLLQNAPLLVDEFGSNWYLRGDIGYRFNNDVDGVRNLDNPPAVHNPDINSGTWVFGGGVGYKWDWLRSDLTADFSNTAKFEADSRFRANDFKARIDTSTVLLNAYADLGTWWGLTPYLGAGAGFAHLKTSSFHIASQDAGQAASDTSWNFAWAVMAGVSYSFSANYHIDIGYRHVNMGDVWTNVDRDRNRLAFKGISADEIRIGFRYTID